MSLAKIMFVVMGLACTALEASKIEEELWSYIFNGYNKHVRPSEKLNEVMRVDFFLTLLQLISVDEKSEEMTTSQYITLRWHDRRLSWNPDKFEGIQGMRIPSQLVWKPDLALSNNIDGNYDKTVPVNAILKSDGLVEWIPPAIYRSACSIKVAYFPFDWQNCTLRFQSFTYGANEVQLNSLYSKVVVDQEAYTDNGEWKVIHCPVKVNRNPKDENYLDVTLYFIIQRKPLFYIINIIIPCVLISSLSVLVFYLPSGCSEKTNMSISVLLGLPVYLLLLAKRVPETSLGVPLIGAYLLFTMLSVTFSVIFSVVVLNVHHRSPYTHTMSPWVKKFFIEYLPPLLHIDIQMTNAKRELDEKMRKQHAQDSAKNAMQLNKVVTTSVSEDSTFDDEATLKNPSFVKIDAKRLWNDCSKKATGHLARYHGSMRRKCANSEGCRISRYDFADSSVSRVTPESNTPVIRNTRTFRTFRGDSKTILPPEIIPPNVENDETQNKRIENTSRDAAANSELSDSGQEEYFNLTCNETITGQNNTQQLLTNSPATRRDDYFNITPSAVRSLENEVTKHKPDMEYRSAKYHPHARPRRTRTLPSKTNHKSGPYSREDQDKLRGIETPKPIPRNRRRKKKSVNKVTIHSLPENLNDCLQAVDFIGKHVQRENAFKEQILEWQIVAMVLDRVMFWTFLVIYLGGSLYFAIQALTNFPPEHPFISGESKYASCWNEHDQIHERARPFV